MTLRLTFYRLGLLLLLWMLAVALLTGLTLGYLNRQPTQTTPRRTTPGEASYPYQEGR